MEKVSEKSSPLYLVLNIQSQFNYFCWFYSIKMSVNACHVGQGQWTRSKVIKELKEVAFIATWYAVCGMSTTNKRELYESSYTIYHGNLKTKVLGMAMQILPGRSDHNSYFQNMWTTSEFGGSTVLHSAFTGRHIVAKDEIILPSYDKCLHYASQKKSENGKPIIGKTVYNRALKVNLAMKKMYAIWTQIVPDSGFASGMTADDYLELTRC